MRKTGDPLDRLLQAAARAPQPAAPPTTAALEMRCLAGWRATWGTEDAVLLVFWLRRAMPWACALVLLSAAWNVGSALHRTTAEYFIEDGAVQIALNQP